MMFRIRAAADADAAAAISTLRRSITDLCGADHRNDPDAIAAWLGNKTRAGWQTWISREDAIMLVAEQDGAVVGVAMTDVSGEILLNYVHPDARFSGVSKAMLAAMEDAARARGAAQCRLESTLTARRFCEDRGYRPQVGRPGILAKPLRSKPRSGQAE